MSGQYVSARRASGRRARARRPDDTDVTGDEAQAGTPAEESAAEGGREDPAPAPAGGNRGGGDRGSGNRGGGDRGSNRGGNPGGDRGGDRTDDPEARAREICLRLLTFEPRTRAQLAHALRRRGIADHVADSVLERFTDAGLIDDAAFARAWVESRRHSRGLAGRALSAELKQRGVDDEEIREAVAELGPDADVITARELVARKLPATRGQPAQARMRRLAGMLARKGYSPGLAFRVIREAMEAEGTDADLEEEPPFDDPYFDTE
jgi:regulatory protein